MPRNRNMMITFTFNWKLDKKNVTEKDYHSFG